jgi:cytochrome c oxidase subunit 2
MVGVIIVVVLLYVIVLFRFRERRGQEKVIPKQVEGNHTLEIIWTVIPIILILALAIPTFTLTFKLADTAPAADGQDTINVKITAHQFWWQFEYPDLGVTTGQELVIPANAKINIQVTSADVTHAFWVPALAGKIDANPGLINKTWFTADEPGIYQGRCAELCGDSHALMDFKVVAVTPDEFNAWIDKMKKPAYEATPLAEQGKALFEKSGCVGCHAVAGTGGPAGPNLTDFGDRSTIGGFIDHTPDNLKLWINNAPSMKEGITMPSYDGKFTDDQLNALAEYLMSLKVQ